MPRPAGYVAIDIAEFRARTNTITQLLADGAVPNGTLTHLGFVHIIVSTWMAEGLTEEEMGLNFASLIASSMNLAGIRLPPEERTSTLHRVAEKH
jgi:hypothetical protein